MAAYFPITIIHNFLEDIWLNILIFKSEEDNLQVCCKAIFGSHCVVLEPSTAWDFVRVISLMRNNKYEKRNKASASMCNIG